MERFDPESLIIDLSSSPLELLRTLDEAFLAAVVDGFVDSRTTDGALFNNGSGYAHIAITTRGGGATADDTCAPSTA